MSSIIMISGPPGAGKTTVAKELVASSTGPTVCIEGDKFWPFFAKGGPGKVRMKIFRTMLCAARAAARPEWAIEDYSNYEAFYADFNAPKPNMIGDDSGDPAAIAALIREGLAEGRFRLPPPL